MFVKMHNFTSVNLFYKSVTDVTSEKCIQIIIITRQFLATVAFAVHTKIIIALAATVQC